MEFVPRLRQPEMPWANGGGSTRQVAIEPPGGSLAAGFDWRVSVAEVASDGPFSVLPGVDRSLWLLAGAGFELDVGGRIVRLDRALQRFDFAGETSVVSRLSAGPCTDLNVMVRRDRVRADAAIVRVPALASHESATASTGLLLVLSGALRVVGLGVDASVGDAVRYGAACDTRVVAGPAGATLLIARFEPVGSGGGVPRAVE